MATHSRLVSAFSLLRVGIGAVGLLSPSLAGKTFGLDINSAARIVSRLFGARELALGILLWNSNSRTGNSNAAQATRGHQDLGTILAIGLCIDSVDSISSLVSVWEGSMDGKAIWLVGWGAAVAAGVGAGLLRAM